MNHLYNKYRPNTLDEIKGQEETVSIMKGIIESGNLPHTMLFVGVRGTGKTSIGRIFSRYVNCEHPTKNGPCNECAACREILNESSMDVLEYDGASNNKVDDIHQLMESAKYEPVRKKKVFIIDECHALSTAAWQSVLKILEEPPKNTIFILCTTEVHKVPATIISRCRTFYFKQISTDVIKDQLAEICQKESISYDMEGLALIAKSAKGSMRDALSMLEQFSVSGASCDRVRRVLGLTSEESIFGLINGIVEGKSDICLSILHEVLSVGKDARQLVNDLITALTDIIYFIQSGDYDEIHNTESYKVAVKDMAYKVTVIKCMDMIKAFSSIYATASKTGETEFILQTCILNLILEKTELALMQERIDELSQKVSELDKALHSGMIPENHTSEPVLATSQPNEVSQNAVPVMENNNAEPEFSAADDGIPFDKIPDALSIGIGGSFLEKAKVVGTVDLFGTATMPEPQQSDSNNNPTTHAEVMKQVTPAVTSNTSTSEPQAEPEPDFFPEVLSGFARHI